MAGKIQLKLKKKEAAPAAAGPAAGVAPTAAPAFTMPAASSGGIVLELRGATINIAEVVIKPRK